MYLNKKVLICITTCNRYSNIKKFSKNYVDFCEKNKKYDFLIALDGSNTLIKKWANRNKVPCIYSDRREGVGISKNRVLKNFNNYNYYFFLDDDVELIDGNVFNEYLLISKKINLHHLSLGEPYRFFESLGNTKFKKYKMLNTKFGSGAFNFFTREGLEKVGGWHKRFSKYKRFGHTEHSYRFYQNKISPAPFITIEGADKSFVWHNPIPTTKVRKYRRTKNHLALVEQNLIKRKLKFYPFKTICGYHLNKYARRLLNT